MRVRFVLLTTIAAVTASLTLQADEPGDKADRQCLIVVVGAPGTDEYLTELSEWADRLTTRCGVRRRQVRTHRTRWDGGRAFLDRFLR